MNLNTVYNQVIQSGEGGLFILDSEPTDDAWQKFQIDLAETMSTQWGKHVSCTLNGTTVQVSVS